MSIRAVTYDYSIVIFKNLYGSTSKRTHTAMDETVEHYSDMIESTLLHYDEDVECDSVRAVTIPSFPKASKRFEWSEIQRDGMILKSVFLSDSEELRAIVELVGNTTSLVYIDAVEIMNFAAVSIY